MIEDIEHGAHVIIAGDWNDVANPALDKLLQSEYLLTAWNAHIQPHLTTLGVEDIF